MKKSKKNNVSSNRVAGLCDYGLAGALKQNLPFLICLVEKSAIKVHPAKAQIHKRGLNGLDPSNVTHRLSW